MFSDKWHKRFMDVAELVSTWSKDPSTKVGAIVVGPDREIRSYRRIAERLRHLCNFHALPGLRPRNYSVGYQNGRDLQAGI